MATTATHPKKISIEISRRDDRDLVSFKYGEGMWTAPLKPYIPITICAGCREAFEGPILDHNCRESVIWCEAHDNCLATLSVIMMDTNSLDALSYSCSQGVKDLFDNDTDNNYEVHQLEA